MKNKKNDDFFVNKTIEKEYSTAVVNLVRSVVPKMVDSSYKFIKEKYNADVNSFQGSYIDYLNSILEDIGYIKTLYNRYTPKLVEEIFVETSLKNKTKTILSDEIEKLLKISPPFIQINGVGGIGKTTTLKYIFIQVLKQQQFIPVYIELKKITMSMNLSELTQFIHKSMTRYNYKLNENEFVSTLDTGKYVLFFDGFDEINPKYQDSIFESLNDLKTKYNKNHYFISSRNTELMKLGWTTSTILELQPLEDAQSLKMLDKISDFDEDTLTRFKESVKNPLFYSKYYEFISNPLLLSLMLLTFNQFAELPEKLHLFYDRAFSSLYSEHDATKENFVRVKKMEQNGVTYDEFVNILAYFSLITYSERKSSFQSKKELFDYFDICRENGELEKFSNEDLLYDLCDSICLLVNDNDEYRFLHRSFQEYFAGCYIETLTDNQQKSVLNNLFFIDKEMFYSDEFFSMMYDKNKSRMNLNFIKPMLADFLSKFQHMDEHDILWNFFFNDTSDVKVKTKRRDMLNELYQIAHVNVSLSHNKSGKEKIENLAKPITPVQFDKELNLAFFQTKILNHTNFEDIKKTTNEDFLDLCLNFIKKIFTEYNKKKYNLQSVISDEKLRDSIKNQSFYEEWSSSYCKSIDKFNQLKKLNDIIGIESEIPKNGSIADLFRNKV